MTKEIVYIGLGSNLEEPIGQIDNALSALASLPETILVRQSSFYLSDSLLEGQPRYVNAVVCLETSLLAEDLLTELQGIENNQGRERGQRWGARTLDLDIILYGVKQINTPRLTIPHSQMALRSFVIVPLLEIAPDVCLPNGQKVAALLGSCPSQNLEKLSDIK